LVIFGVAFLSSEQLPRALGPVVGLSGLAYLAQGWIAGAEGFSRAQSVAIVLGWGLSLIWMIWLVVAAWLIQRERYGSGVNAGDVRGST
jgi:hypothetical protein